MSWHLVSKSLRASERKTIIVNWEKLCKSEPDLALESEHSVNRQNTIEGLPQGAAAAVRTSQASVVRTLSVLPLPY
jgi:hypothetical protein